MPTSRLVSANDERFTLIQGAGIAVIIALLVVFMTSLFSGSGGAPGPSGHVGVAAAPASGLMASVLSSASSGASTGTAALTPSAASGAGASVSGGASSSAGGHSSAAGSVSARASTAAAVSHRHAVRNATGSWSSGRHAAGHRVTRGGNPVAAHAVMTSPDSSPAAGGSPASPQTTSTTTTSSPVSSPASPAETTAATNAVSDAAPAGPDGTWIVPPIPGSSDALGNALPGIPGLATGPAPDGDVLALGPPGSEYAFDATTRTWILAPTSGVSYKPGVGYVSGSSASSTDATTLPPVDTSVPAGPDGAWIVAPVLGGLDSDGMNLPSLPGVATGPAPAGNVLAVGPDGSQYAFDVTTRTWILASSTNVGY